jgi:hypothetical protein
MGAVNRGSDYLHRSVSSMMKDAPPKRVKEESKQLSRVTPPAATQAHALGGISGDRRTRNPNHR